MADEERTARAALDEMQYRISQGPYAALGLGGEAAPEDVRAAFLALTKQFHPARFGRMSSEVQRYSNEVFLGIRSAHDQLQKSLGGTARPAGHSGGFQAMSSEGTGKTPAPQLIRRTSQIPTHPERPPTGQVPIQRPKTGPMRAVDPPTSPPQQFARGTDRPAGQRPSSPAMPTPAAGSRAVTPNTAPGGGQRPSSPVIGARPTQPIAKTPPMGIPIQRPITPVAGRPGTPPLRPATPAPPGPPRPSSDLNPATVRGVQAAPSSSQAIPRQGPAFDQRTALRECMMSLNEGEWAKARQGLEELAAKAPDAKSYRALLCYARGREAQAAGRPDEALLEIQRALEIDPDLDLAKQAQAELSRRR